jgi:hypothetical protein
MATEPHEQMEAAYQARIKERNAKIAEIRQRSGLSMDDLAKAMGYAGQSSIQRYLSPDYDLGFRPELAWRFRAALIGKGNPPITDLDLQVFLDGSLIPPGDPVYEHLDHGTNLVKAMASIDRGALASGVTRASLPVLEGTVKLELPSTLSSSSAETVRVWLSHLVNLACDVADTADRRKPQK